MDLDRDKRLAAVQRWNERHPDRLKANRKVTRQRRLARDPLMDRRLYLRKRFGITIDDYDRMLAAQNGLCAICGEPEKGILKRTGKRKALAVDHDHKTGKIRQLLCAWCNTALARIEADRSIVTKINSYLDRHGNG